jgi:cell division protein FtsB
MKKADLLNSIARFIKYNRIAFLFILIIISLIYFALFSNKGFIQRFKLEKDKTVLKQELDKELLRSEELKKEINDLNTSDAKIEKVAREKYGMTKEGEIIYKVLVDSTK